MFDSTLELLLKIYDPVELSQYSLVQFALIINLNQLLFTYNSQNT